MVRKMPQKWFPPLHVIFSRICRAIPQTCVAQRPTLFRKKKRGNSGPLFLAGNVEVWLLKVAAAATVAAMVVLKASIQEWWIPFWVTETPCLPEASLSSIPPSHEPSVHTSVSPSIRPLKLLKLLIMSMRPALKHTHMCVCFRRRGNRRVVFK